MKRLDFLSSSFDSELAELLAWDAEDDAQIQTSVAEVIRQVRQRGDAAVLDYTAQFDRLEKSQITELICQPEALEAAWRALPGDQADALQQAANRIEAYAKYQALVSWEFEDDDGNRLGQKITPMNRVGVYVPGGKAAYPSSVLMNVIPAKVAGVSEIIMVSPAPDGNMNRMVLAAAWLAGVDRVFMIGGAQAVAALAYGTETIPMVDKIVGPGNIYVATAKKQVFGQVGIDMVAGPSEILIVCDGKTPSDWIAMDLFSQAEHDENAQSILISPDAEFLAAVESSIEALLPSMERADVIRSSIEGRGGMIHVPNLESAAEVVNRIAPEHLELSVEDPDQLLPLIQNAGAIFLGRYTAEALGDYCAGPNHVLPTSGTARFSSPLGVYDFQKRSSLIGCSAQGAAKLADVASVLARGESLTAHARSAEYRK